jgi:hypothetical protein
MGRPWAGRLVGVTAAMAKRQRLLVDEPPLLVLPTLAQRLGLQGAIVTQQLHYWVQQPTAHAREGRRWVYNSYQGWQRQFPFWSVATVKRIFLALERRGVVLSAQFRKGAWDRRKWYTLDYVRLAELVPEIVHDGQDSSHRWGQHGPLEGTGLDRSMGTICAALEYSETPTKTSPENSSSTTADAAAEPAGSHPDHGPLPDGAEPGELHTDLVVLLRSLATTAFHALAEPTKRHETFWDAQVDLIQTQSHLTFEEVVRDVDAYYASHPEKCPKSAAAAMRAMAFGIKFALKQTRFC